MKKYILVLLAALTLAACNKPFEENYPQLVLDSYEYKLNSNGGSLHVMVYYSGSWTAEILPSVGGNDWLELSRSGAPGQAYIRISYASAVNVERTAFVEFYPESGEPVQLTLTQPKK